MKSFFELTSVTGQKQLKQLKNENLKLKSNLQLKQIQISQLHEQMKKLQYQIRNIQKQNKQLQSINEEIQIILINQKSQKIKLKASQTSLIQKIKYLETTISQIRSELAVYKFKESKMQHSQIINFKRIDVYSRSAKIYLECLSQQFETYKIKIHQIHSNQKENRQMQYEANEILIRQLKPQTQYRFQIMVKLRDRQTIWYSIPQFSFKTKNLKQMFIPYDLQTEQEKQLYIEKKLKQIKLRLDLQMDFPELKISLFGSIGQGKSSILNTINSIIKGSYNPVSMSGNSNTSVTKQSIKVRDILSTKIPLSILDIFGIQLTKIPQKEKSYNPLLNSNYQQIFHSYFDGLLYNSYKVNEVVDKQKLVQYQDGIDRLSHQIQGVIYVISYHFLNNKEGMEQTKHIIKLLLQKGIKPVIALTKCDQLLQNAPIADLSSSERLEPFMKLIIQKLVYITKEDIFVVSNYLSNTRRNFAKQYFMLNMFEQVIIRAKQRLYQNLQKFFWLQKQDQSYYGLIQSVGQENLGYSIEPILKSSFKKLGIQLERLMFLECKYNFGQKIQRWVKAEEFMKTKLLYFIDESQKRKIIKIKEKIIKIIKSTANIMLGETSLLTIPIYDPIQRKKLGIINLGNLTIDKLEELYELQNYEQEFSVMNQNKVIQQKDYKLRKLSEVMKDSFLSVKLHQQSPKYLVSVLQNQILIDQCYIPTKSGMKTKEFYNLIRNQLPDIVQEYKLCKCKTIKALPQNDEPLSSILTIKDGEITLNLIKK